MHRDIAAIQEKIHAESAFVGRLLDEVGRVIVGQRYMIERLLIGLLADGHVLLEGVPGLAKTIDLPPRVVPPVMRELDSLLGS